MFENNAQDMKTVVETYYVEETQSLIHNQQDLSRWSDLVTFLDLPNQANLAKEDKSPVPFLWMNSTLVSVIETLCPTKTELSAYNKTPIPIEALEVIALSKRENYFDLIEVWYDEEDKDPAIIGYIMDKARESDWMKKAYAEKYLLARWADVRASFEELTKKAFDRYISRQTVSLKRNIIDYTRQLEDLPLEAARRFGFSKGQIGNLLPF